MAKMLKCFVYTTLLVVINYVQPSGNVMGGLMFIQENVDTGEVRVSREKMLFRARAIGSCVVVTAYDPKYGAGKGI